MTFGAMYATILVVCFLALLLYLASSWRDNRFGGLREWVPKAYIDDLKACKIRQEQLIEKGEEIPRDTPTLFIVGRFQTQSNSIRLVDHLAHIFTAGWLRFNEILPVGAPLTLRLYFRNISRDNPKIEGRTVRFFIRYPNEETPSRKWSIRIPTLASHEECPFLHTPGFLTPEVPGTHELMIEGIEGIRIAGPSGVAGRKYRIPDPGEPWLLSFHVSNAYEHKAFLISFVALTAAAISLLATILQMF